MCRGRGEGNFMEICLLFRFVYLSYSINVNTLETIIATRRF